MSDRPLETAAADASASIYEQERRQKLQKLRDLGVDPGLDLRL